MRLWRWTGCVCLASLMRSDLACDMPASLGAVLLLTLEQLIVWRYFFQAFRVVHFARLGGGAACILHGSGEHRTDRSDPTDPSDFLFPAIASCACDRGSPGRCPKWPPLLPRCACWPRRAGCA